MILQVMLLKLAHGAGKCWELVRCDRLQMVLMLPFDAEEILSAMYSSPNSVVFNPNDLPGISLVKTFHR